MIYCVEDDSSIRDLVVYTLENTGFVVRGFGTGAELFSALAAGTDSCTLVLLDIMLPGEDGISILRRLRSDSLYRSIPVIMLTAKGSEYDKVIGLDSGADDYIAKPFGMMELIARIRSVLRRTSGSRGMESSGGVYTYGELVLDSRAYTVSVSGVPVDLTRKEFELLLLFMQNTGMVLTRDTILERVWGYDFNGETRTVDVHIRTLRQKLEEKKNGYAGLIETVRGIGYRLPVPKPQQDKS
jgi:two-component system alkaline phosphatase synthesis response regulator PhoP